MKGIIIAVALAVIAVAMPIASAQNPACTTGAQNLVSDCNNLITLFENNPSLQKEAAGLNGATDAQIQAAINAVPNEKPSATCCSTAQSFLSAGCRCDANVIPLAQGLSLQPGEFYSIGRAGILACNLPKSTDTAPNPCPAPAGGK